MASVKIIEIHWVVGRVIVRLQGDYDDLVKLAAEFGVGFDMWGRSITLEWNSEDEQVLGKALGDMLERFSFPHE